MHARFFATLLLVAASIVLSVAHPTVTPESYPIVVMSSEEPLIVDAQMARAGVGLDATIGHVRELIGSTADVGTEHWGIPMTASEALDVDLIGRGEFVNLGMRSTRDRGGVSRRAWPTSSGTCTMGFHIEGGEYGAQFITAGHCGAAYTSTKWYHQGGSTYVGGELATLLVNNGIDAMRINITPNSYGDNHMYGDGTFIQSSLSYRNPIAGETLCANLGVSASASKCGTVTDASISWTSTITGYTVTGADLSISTIDGDSGSPIHTPGDPGDYVWAVGINDNSYGNFARMGSIMAKPAFDGLLLLYGQS